MLRAAAQREHSQFLQISGLKGGIKRKTNCDTSDLKACRFTQGWCPHAAHQLIPPSCPTLHKTSPRTRPHLTHLRFRSIKAFSCSEENHNETLQVSCSPSAVFGCCSGCLKPAVLRLTLFSPTRTMQATTRAHREVLKRNLTITFAARMISSQLLALVMQNKTYRRRFKS